MNKQALGAIAQDAYGQIRIKQNFDINEGGGEYDRINTDYYAFLIVQAVKSVEITPVMFHGTGHSSGISIDQRDNP